MGAGRTVSGALALIGTAALVIMGWRYRQRFLPAVALGLVGVGLLTLAVVLLCLTTPSRNPITEIRQRIASP
jgi:O-antigen ligase